MSDQHVMARLHEEVVRLRARTRWYRMDEPLPEDAETILAQGIRGDVSEYSVAFVGKRLQAFVGWMYVPFDPPEPTGTSEQSPSYLIGGVEIDGGYEALR